MEFYIKQNSTLPVLKMEIIKDGRSDFNLNSFLSGNSTFLISLYDKSNDKFLFASKECFVTSEYSEFEGKDLYYLNYQFTNKDTLKTGRYEVQVSITSEQGVILLPLQDKYYVNVLNSFSVDNLGYDTLYSANLPCCGFNQTFDVGGLNLDIYYYSGSLVVNYILTSTETLNSSIGVSFTNILYVISGDPILIITGVTINAGEQIGETQITYPDFDYNNLTQITDIKDVVISVVEPNTVLNLDEQIFFNTPPPTRTPTKTPTPTLTSTPASTIAETPTNTPTNTVTTTPTVTQTITPSITETITSTRTPSVTETPTQTVTPTNTSTLTPTNTETPTSTPTNTETPTSTSTPTNTETPTNTPTPSETSVGETVTPTPTNTETPTNTPTESETPTPTVTPSITETPTVTPTPTNTETPTNTPTNSETPTNTPTQTSTNTPTPSITPTVTQSPAAAIPFVSSWSADTSYSNTITLPYLSGGTYTGTIDWGDGNISANTFANRTHTYASSGLYSVSVNGQITGFNFFVNSNERNKIFTIQSWGQIRGLNDDNSQMFRGCTALDLSLVSDTLNMVGITATTSMFQSCSSLSFIPGASTWDMSSVVDMSSMFYLCVLFNESEITSWDTSNVTNMSYMLAAANTASPAVFNQDIGGWDVSSVTDMSYMFYNNTSFDQNVGNWDTNSVTTMEGMFYNSSSFDNGGSTDISLWRTNSLTNIDYMFRGATSFNQPINSDGSTYWNLAGLTQMLDTFRQATSFNQDLSLWDVSNVNTFFRTFLSATTFNQDLSTWDVSNVTNATNMLDYTAISTQNYNNLLASWSNLTLQSDVVFGVQGLLFGAGTPQGDRQFIIDTYNWNFVGDAKG
jgi:surface protein